MFIHSQEILEDSVLSATDDLLFRPSCILQLSQRAWQTSLGVFKCKRAFYVAVVFAACGEGMECNALF